MFFSTIANLLSSIPTFVFPVFASYKALKTTDPALLTPWLMYWVVLACALLVESWVGFILFWIPFYAWFRLFFLLYLILPQTQGAKVLYQEQVHPFLEKNELAIDDFISSAHDRAKAAGLTYLKQIIDLVKQTIFGIPPKQPTPPATPSTFSYTQSLLARFNLPSARPATAAATSTANDFYSLLASAVTAATSTGTGKQSRDLSNSGVLIPPSVDGEDRLSFISAQRERLSILLSALDKEASTLQNQKPRSKGLFDGAEDDGDRPRSAMSGLSGISGLSTRKSEVDFEKIDAESGTEEIESQRREARRSQSAGWMPWSWGARQESSTDTVIAETEHEIRGKSSGVDI
ncbi:TB2/DP1, HVA22 family-domain-containing protein [Bisporella sp. PMI_857]|nr:TB2/DP1, HVA22 family-domain-containing protein [Bisporella sp. PMI_857]